MKTKTGLFTALFVALAFSPGCMRALRGPALDHAVQVDTIARKCQTPVATGGYTDSPCSPELQRDLDEMSKQADCVLAISEGRACGEESEQ